MSCLVEPTLKALTTYLAKKNTQLGSLGQARPVPGRGPAGRPMSCPVQYDTLTMDGGAFWTKWGSEWERNDDIGGHAVEL